jgi:hypothetical protein
MQSPKALRRFIRRVPMLVIPALVVVVGLVMLVGRSNALLAQGFPVHSDHDDRDKPGSHSKAPSKASLNGNYAFQVSSTHTTPNCAPGVYVTEVDYGVVTFDGRGNFTVNITFKNSNFTAGCVVADPPAGSFIGTYTVNADGTGALNGVGNPLAFILAGSSDDGPIRTTLLLHEVGSNTGGVGIAVRQ